MSRNIVRDPRTWDLVAKSGKDRISRGGWKNSYTGEAFSEAEMREYADDVYLKLAPYLTKAETVVLEIGCASGITMYRLQPHVKKYIGTDMASVNLDLNTEYNQINQIDNIDLYRCKADEICECVKERVNIVIMNSVIQYFESEAYFIDVFQKCMGLLDDGGIIYIGDIRDGAKKEEYKRSLEFAGVRGAGGFADIDRELFFEREWIKDLCREYSAVEEVEITEKIGDIDNELKKFRFDALIRIKSEKK